MKFLLDPLTHCYLLQMMVALNQPLNNERNCYYFLNIVVVLKYCSHKHFESSNSAAIFKQ